MSLRTTPLTMVVKEFQADFFSLSFLSSPSTYLLTKLERREQTVAQWGGGEGRRVAEWEGLRATKRPLGTKWMPLVAVLQFSSGDFSLCRLFIHPSKVKELL